MFAEIASIVIGYLLGSIPTAYIITRFRKGVDIRKVDVGNVGAASVIRQVGLIEGLIVALVDMAKGAGTIFIAQALGVSYYWVLAAGFAALIGHIYPAYIRFKGGQGIATIIGIFFALAPEATAVLLVLMAIMLLIVHRIFFMNIMASPFLPLFMWLFERSLTLVIYSLAIVIFVGYRNRHGFKELAEYFIKKKR